MSTFRYRAEMDLSGWEYASEHAQLIQKGLVIWTYVKNRSTLRASLMHPFNSDEVPK